MKQYTFGEDPIVVGRTPALPLCDIFEIFRAPDPLGALKTLLRDNAVVRTAVAVASPSLHGAMNDWILDRPLRNSAAPLRLLAYVARMSTRPTPFGFFASIGEVKTGSVTSLALGENGTRRAQTRPDMGWLFPLAREVEKDAVLRLSLRVTLNPNIIERSGRLHVMNPNNVRLDDGGEARRIEHTPTSLKKTQAVEFVLEFVREPMLLSEVVRELAERFSAQPGQAEKLVGQLWEAGLFISEMRPNPCGEPARSLGARVAETHPRGEEIRDVLVRAEELNGAPVRDISVERYAGIVDALRAVHDEPTTLQVDSTHTFTGTLGDAVLQDVLHLADAYVRCSGKMSLAKYRESFMRRYEGVERLVPLLELVNPDFGLGAPAEPEMLDETDAPARNQELIELAMRAFAAGERVVHIDDATYERVCRTPVHEEIPPGFEIGFQIAASSRDAVERGEYMIVPSNMMATTGAGRSVGRFAAALGNGMSERLARFARAANGDRIVAEMTFLPPSLRSVNVAQRPNPYGYEVPIGVINGDAETILPSDILVGIRNERFFLYSKRLGREITVRESHVFNTTEGAPDICRFLSFVERDGVRTFVGFDWSHAGRLPVLPRLMHGRVVLSPMLWRASKSMFEGSTEQVAVAVAAWRAKWNLPRLAYLRDFDQWLPVDFACQLSLDMLRDQLKRNKEERLEFCEVLPGEDETWITSEGGSDRYATEFIASILAPHQPQQQAAPVVRVNESSRTLGPDSQWLYLKLYCGNGQLDVLLAQHIAPLLGDLYQSDAIDRAFFLRYADPDAHIRLRLRRSPALSSGALFERVASACGALLEARLIERYTFDTYVRELERYGGEANIEDVEMLFSEDSARCLPSITGATRTQHRKVTDSLLSMRWILDGMLDESEYERYLAYRGRPSRKLSAEDWTIAKAVRAEFSGDPHPRSDVFERIRERLVEQTETRYYLIDSLLHMHCNRLGLERAVEVRTMEILWHVCSGVRAQRAANPTPV